MLGTCKDMWQPCLVCLLVGQNICTRIHTRILHGSIYPHTFITHNIYIYSIYNIYLNIYIKIYIYIVYIIYI